MSASRSFIDVLVGKLTAYVDVSSRPAPSVLTPVWAASLDAVPVTPWAASRAYLDHLGTPRIEGPAANDAPTANTATSREAPRPTDTAAGLPWFEAIMQARTPGPADDAAATSRTPAELAAIQLLRRLGATSLTARASDLEIRAAWRQLLRECHPDAHPHAREADRVVLTARLRAVIRARDILEPRAAVDQAAA